MPNEKHQVEVQNGLARQRHAEDAQPVKRRRRKLVLRGDGADEGKRSGRKRIRNDRDWQSGDDGCGVGQETKALRAKSGKDAPGTKGETHGEFAGSEQSEQDESAQTARKEIAGDAHLSTCTPAL